MAMSTKVAANIDDYIAGFPPAIQAKLKTMRATIKKAAPKAEEAIKYAMPTYVYHGNLVHFAAFKNHIGFYPAPKALVEFDKELAKYVRSKGAVQFPLDEPIPTAIVTKIVKYRVKEAEGK